MSDQRIAYRYAKALIELAEEQKALTHVWEDMKLVAAVCKENYAFRLMLNNPVITHDKKLKILTALFGKSAHKITISYIQIITRKNRERFLESTAVEFNRLYNIKKGIEEASVTTTFELDESLRDEFQKVVKDITGNEVILNEKVDKELLGGFVLKIQDRQIDESVRSKLRELEFKFEENPYQAKL